MAVFRPFFNFWNYLDNSQQFVSCCLGKCRPLFSSVDQFCVCRAKLNFFALKQSFNSPSKNFRSIGKQFVMSVVGQPKLKHLKLFLNVGQLKLIETYPIQITLNINCLSVDKRRLVQIVFIEKIKQFPFCYKNIFSISKYLCHLPTVKIKLYGNVR